MKKISILMFVFMFFSTATVFAQAPTITSFTPISANPSDAVTLIGPGFSTTTTNNIVFFGAIRATITAANATTVTVTLPTEATNDP